MREEIERFISNSAKDLALIQSKHDMKLRHDNVREKVINQHTRNCNIRIGIQTSTLHHENVENKVMLKNLNTSVQATNHMFHLTHEMVRNETASRNGLHVFHI